MFLRKILIVLLCFILFSFFGYSKIYLSKDKSEKIFLVNKLENNTDDRYIKNFKKYKLVYVNQDEFEELKEKNDQLEELNPEEINEYNYDEEISIASRTYNIEFNLIKSIIKAFSKFDKNFQKNNKFGMMGINKKWFSNNFDAFDSKKNILLGTKILREYLVKYEYDLLLALSSYFLSTDEVDRFFRKTGDIPPDKNCRIFIKDVITNYNSYNSVSSISIKKQYKGKEGKFLLYNIKK
jgi:hypothetical protein